MTNLDELLRKYNPNGVSPVKLGDVLDYEQPSKYIVSSSEYDDNYDIPVLTAGQSFILGYTDETDGVYKASKKNPTIIFDDFTTGYHWVDFDFKVKSSAMKMLRLRDNNSLLRYVFHSMALINYFPSEHSRQWISKYSQFEIPLPHKKVQEEIVEILDSFTNLIDALNEELSLRQKQFEYYREKLLTFKTNDENVIFDILENIAPYSKKRINSEMLNAENYVGVDNLLQNKEGKDISNSVPTSGNWTRYDEGDILVGNIRPYLKKIWFADSTGGASGDVLVISLKDKSPLLPKYLFYLLSSDNFFEYDNNSARGAGMPRGDKKVICRYSISFPKDKDIQQSIVEKLDAFESLISSLKEEIALRQKQYEYYREKLLTFN